ncbi:MAG: excinuclease ABC subunit UvrC [Thermodesulfobacteriota bacterium]
MKQVLLKHQDLDPESLRKSLPAKPGVYLFKDGAERILYVGKAKDLKKRVLSYVKSSDDLSGKTRMMISRAGCLETIITDTENEAFILEDTLIKRHMPRYNVIFRDDKRYPCLRLDLRHTYPRLQVVRRIRKDGALYYGPFSSAGSVRDTLKLIETVFPLRKCRGNRPPKRSRPCLNYQLGRCLGPCTEEVPADVYGELLVQVRLFLEGRNRELLGRLSADMKSAADSLQFERAARIRDRIRGMKQIVERQNVVSGSMEDRDVIGLAGKGDIFQVVILHVRKGALAGSLSFRFRSRNASQGEVMAAFVKQYYAGGVFIPGDILISHPVEDITAIGSWLSDLGGRRVALHQPKRGEKRRLVGMAVKNAENLLERQAAGDVDIMELVRVALQMGHRPERIECIDISNIQGSQAVGTVAAFREGEPDSSRYRNYRIRTQEGIDDYAMMAETAGRRLSKGDLPDLLLVDGGKGHLAAVERVVNSLRPADRPALAAIAKRDERLGEPADKVFIPGRRNPLSLGPDHPVLHLLMRIRDETHRRAVGYHRRLRGKAMTASLLDAVPGIGPKRKKALLNRFGDLEVISRTAPEALSELPGINLKTAQMVLDVLKTKESHR